MKSAPLYLLRSKAASFDYDRDGEVAKAALIAVIASICTAATSLCGESSAANGTNVQRVLVIFFCDLRRACLREELEFHSNVDGDIRGRNCDRAVEWSPALEPLNQ